MISAEASSPLGNLRLVSNGQALVGLYFEAHSPAPRFDGPAGEDEVLRATRAQLREYFEGRRQVFDLPLAREGTAFQEQVWSSLAAIPWGALHRYGEIAAALGRPRSARAVGACVARNPLSIVVPCHRVVGASGALTGFAGGVERKRWLLAHEGHSV